MPFVTPSRRRLLKIAGAAALAPGLLGARRADEGIRVLAISDMHSAYERTSQLLRAFETEVGSNPAPHLIAINGDIFEQGNVVALRSGGVVDWAFLAALPNIAPTVVNLGNHDNDLTPDLALVVARLKALGVHVVTTIGDARTGVGYAQPALDIRLGSRSLRVVGLATNSLETYPKDSREQLSIPSAADWANAHLGPALEGADLVLVMSHAGVAEDRRILPLLPDGGLMIGGHNHLLFQHPQGRSLYAHTGSWTAAYTAAEFRPDGSVVAVSRPVALDGPTSSSLADLIATTLATSLTAEEKTVMGTSPQALSLGDTGRRVAAGFARAAGADAGFIGHTTLGTGLPAGPIDRHRFDSIVRFDGKLMIATASPAQVRVFMTRANQDRPMALEDRSGDFLYAAGEAGADGPIRIVTTDWCARNQAEYFGSTDLVFAEVPRLAVKAVAATALLNALPPSGETHA